MRIIHMSSAHQWNDTRIYLKMCLSLVKEGHEVHLIVQGSNSANLFIRDGVIVHTVPYAKSRFERMVIVVNSIMDIAADLNGDIYHFHDPEFLRIACAWQRILKRPFVYDVHENYRYGLIDRTWIPRYIRPITAWLAGYCESSTALRLAAVVVATPKIYCNFRRNKHVELVRNYPMKNELNMTSITYKKRREVFVYTGIISDLRCIKIMIIASGLAGVDLELAGEFDNYALKDECMKLPGSERVNIRGTINRDELRNMLSEALAGMVIYKPIQSHYDAYPTKLFEYMSAGLPVIASNFPLWRNIIQSADCGLLVDPNDPVAIANAMRWIANHSDDAVRMGNNGRIAVSNKYNWESEFPKLLSLYSVVRR